MYFDQWWNLKPPIKDTPKEDKPPNKGRAECTHACTLYRITSERGQPLYKTAGPEGVLILKGYTLEVIKVSDISGVHINISILLFIYTGPHHHLHTSCGPHHSQHHLRPLAHHGRPTLHLLPREGFKVHPRRKQQQGQETRSGRHQHGDDLQERLAEDESEELLHQRDLAGTAAAYQEPHRGGQDGTAAEEEHGLHGGTEAHAGAERGTGAETPAG